MAAALSLSACTGRSLSGLYVANGVDTTHQQPSVVEALRITQAGPNDVTGTIESVTIGNDGRPQSSAFNITGKVDGDRLTLTVEAGPFQSLWGNLSGTTTGSAISLSWLANGRLTSETFMRSTDAEYANALSAINFAAGQKQALLLAQAKAKQVNDNIAMLSSDISAFNSRASQLSNKVCERWLALRDSMHTKKLSFYGESCSIQITTI